MTRNEFLNDVTTWQELVDFCSDVDCDILCDFVFDDEYNDAIEEDLSNALRDDYSWRSIRDMLYDLPEDYNQYMHDDILEFRGLDDDDFDDYKEDVLDWCDDRDVWDDEEDEESPAMEQVMRREEPEEEPSWNAWEDDKDFGQLLGIA